LGALLCASNEGEQAIPATIANAVNIPTVPTERVFVFMLMSSS
jgi:hypothetical protein